MNAEEAQTKANDNSEAAAKNAEKASEAIRETENVSECNNEAAKVSNKQENKFNCELCDFVSNRESGYKIHMTRKHPKIEQLHGLTEDPDLEVQNAIEEGEFEDEIDIYLKTGKIQSNWARLQAVWFDVRFVVTTLIKSYSQEEQAKEVLNLLEAKRLAIEEVHGPGSFMEFHPWKCIKQSCPM